MLTALITVMLSLSASAQEHTHTWEIVPTTEPTLAEMACTTCDQHVIIPTDNLLCTHTFEVVVYDDYHGDQCIDCGYSVLEPHKLIEIGFVDGCHLIECTDCDIQIYHSITEWVDESGHHHKCDVCGKVENYLPHTHENMWAYPLNDIFHTWVCGECGYLECEKHDSDICTVCGHCSHPNLINSSTRDECKVECPDCGYAYSGEHIYNYDGEDTAECSECGREEPVIVQYGILLERTETEDGNFIDFLIDGTIYQYQCWNSSIEIGTFVRVRVVDDQIISIGRRVETDILGLTDVTELCDYLRSNIRSNHEDVESWEEITVSSVTPDGNDLCVEFVAGEKVYFDSEVVIYDMTTSQMGTVEEGDVIVYFTPREEGQKDTIIIIG